MSAKHDYKVTIVAPETGVPLAVYHFESTNEENATYEARRDFQWDYGFYAERVVVEQTSI